MVEPVREFQSAPVPVPTEELLLELPVPSVKSFNKGRSSKASTVPKPAWAIQRSNAASVMVASAGMPVRSKANKPRSAPLLRPMSIWSRAPEFQVTESPRMKVALCA